MQKPFVIVFLLLGILEMIADFQNKTTDVLSFWLPAFAGSSSHHTP